MIDFETEIHDRVAVIRPRGRLDLASAPTLQSLIDDTLRDGHSTIVIDLGETVFIDSTGLGAVIRGLKSARRAGGNLRVARVAGQVEIVLRLTSLDQLLHSYPTVEEALGGSVD